jgi:hypothetical protein
MGRLPRFRPLSSGVFLALLALNLLLRIHLATLPGYLGDVEGYRDWALGTALFGLSAAYEKTAVDYPPVVLYLLRPVGEIYLRLHPEIAGAEVRQAEWGEYFFRTREGRVHRSWEPRPGIPAADAGVQTLPDTGLLTFLVKLPLVLLDLVVAGLLYLLVAREGLWGEARRDPGWARLACLLYAWNPAPLFDVAYWGQADSIHVPLALGSLLLLARSRYLGAGFLLSLAGLMKPLAAPLVPLLAVAAALRGRLAGLVRTGAGGLAAALLVLSPFLVTGRGPEVVEKVLLDVDAMAFTSVNGHTLWWLLGGWRDANAPWLGPLSPKAIGQILFLSAYAALLVRSRHWLRGAEAATPERFGANLFVLAAAVVACFFFLSTHMHENHLLLAVPLLLAVAGRQARLAWLAAGCSAASFLNMVLHDPALPLWLPEALARPAEPSQAMAGTQLTWVQLVGSGLNSLLVAVVAIGSFAGAWQRGGRR